MEYEGVRIMNIFLSSGKWSMKLKEKGLPSTRCSGLKPCLSNFLNVLGTSGNEMGLKLTSSTLITYEHTP